MGLDMYLERMPRYKNTTPREVSAIESYFEWKRLKEDPKSKARNYTLKEWCGVDFKSLPAKHIRDFYERHGSFGYANWDVEQKYSGRYRIIEEVGYWRKANHIHNWFVKNIQNGIDDCCYHNEVTKEDLEELRDICHEIICNKDLAELRLPTRSGFFFGGTDYDEYYFDDIRTTMDIITTVLETTNFDTHMICYISSW